MELGLIHFVGVFACGVLYSFLLHEYNRKLLWTYEASFWTLDGKNGTTDQHVHSVVNKFCDALSVITAHRHLYRVKQYIF